ncbi:hypothetical protein RCL1_002416 [Eukaryota sp. TZLM3-RCL]
MQRRYVLYITVYPRSSPSSNPPKRRKDDSSPVAADGISQKFGVGTTQLQPPLSLPHSVAPVAADGISQKFGVGTTQLQPPLSLPHSVAPVAADGISQKFGVGTTQLQPPLSLPHSVAPVAADGISQKFGVGTTQLQPPLSLPHSVAPVAADGISQKFGVGTTQLQPPLSLPHSVAPVAADGISQKFGVGTTQLQQSESMFPIVSPLPSLTLDLSSGLPIFSYSSRLSMVPDAAAWIDVAYVQQVFNQTKETLLVLTIHDLVNHVSTLEGEVLFSCLQELLLLFYIRNELYTVANIVIQLLFSKVPIHSNIVNELIKCLKNDMLPTLHFLSVFMYHVPIQCFLTVLFGLNYDLSYICCLLAIKYPINDVLDYLKCFFETDKLSMLFSQNRPTSLLYNNALQLFNVQSFSFTNYLQEYDCYVHESCHFPMQSKTDHCKYCLFPKHSDGLKCPFVSDYDVIIKNGLSYLQQSIICKHCYFHQIKRDIRKNRPKRGNLHIKNL